MKKNYSSYPFIALISLFGCTNSNPSVADNSSQNSEKMELLSERTDSTFIPDNFPVSDEILKQHAIEKKSHDILSIEKAWFSNDDLGQILLFDVYTDCHRIATFLFRGNKIPETIITQIELHTSNGELADSEKKRKALPGFVKQATQLEKRFFTTNKQIRLDDNKEKIIQIYGNPDYVSEANGIETDEWIFSGDQTIERSTQKRKMIAKNSFGHRIVAQFKNDQLVGLAFYNEIP